MDIIEGLAQALLEDSELLVEESEALLARAEKPANYTTAFNPRTHSLLTRLLLGLNAPLQVCKSGAGFYVGATTTEALMAAYPDRDLLLGEPLSRDSEEYFPTREAAEAAMRTGNWTQRSHA